MTALPVPQQWQRVTLAVDFDGTLVEANVQPLRWRPNAREFVVAAARSGIQMWLFSCRCGPFTNEGDDPEAFWRTGLPPVGLARTWALYEEMRDFLVREGVWELLLPWTSPGKPNALSFYDDKAEAPNWLVAAAELGVVLANGTKPGGDGALGGPAVGGPSRSPVGAAPEPVAAAADAGAAPGLRLRP